MTPLFDKPSAYESPLPVEPIGPETVVTLLSEIPRRAVRWIWPQRVPIGMLTLLDGDPGMGKSTLVLDLAARVTTGRAMPDGSGGEGGESRSVVLLSAEDDPGAVIGPRFEAAGGDPSRVALVSIQERGDVREPSITDEDMKHVEEAIFDHNAVLLVIDPLVAYLPGGIDTHSDHSVRRALRQLKGVSERQSCAALAVRHFRKVSSENALYRGGGSIGFVGAARSALVLGRDPDDESGQRRVLAVSKASLAPIAPSLAFRLTSDLGADFPRVEWLGVSGHAAGALTGDRRGRTKADEAGEFLRERLAGGAFVPAKTILHEAEKRGISEITLRRASRQLVERQKSSDGTCWLWRLRGQGDQRDVTCSDDHHPGDGLDYGDHLPREHGDAWEPEEGAP